MVTRLDANSDGSVTLEEIPENLRPRFEQLFERLDVEAIEVSRLRELAERQQQLLTTGDNEPADGDRPRGEGDNSREGDRPEGDRPDGDSPRGEGDDSREGEGGDGDQARDADRRVFQGPEFFRRLDTNGDRRLSEAELDNLRVIFGELDRNDDGQLDMPEMMGQPLDNVNGPEGDDEERPRGIVRDDNSRTEGDAARTEGEGGRGEFNPQDLFNRVDADGNGFISQDEAPERLRPDFERADTNDDGQISSAELTAHLGGGRGQAGDGQVQRPEDFLRSLDRNADGFITTDEMPEGRSEEMLNRADSNDDGKISLDEVRSVFGGQRPEGARPESDRPERDRPEAEGDREDN
jgi:collagen type III alpha